MPACIQCCQIGKISTKMQKIAKFRKSSRNFENLGKLPYFGEILKKIKVIWQNFVFVDVTTLLVFSHPMHQAGRHFAKRQ